MARKRIRRSHDEVVALTMSYAKKGPFTPQDLAVHIGFTPNRARQLLEELKGKRKLTALGNRKSLRGKPATLWGLPGTKLTDKDIAARPSPLAGRNGAGRPLPASARSGGFLAALASFLERGIEIAGPDGEVYTISMAKTKGATRRAPARAPRKTRSPRKKAASKRKKAAPGRKKAAPKRKPRARKK